MPRTKISAVLDKDFSTGADLSGISFTTGGAWTTSGGYMVSLGAFDSSPRFAQMLMNNCPAVIEVTVPVQDGFGMTMGGPSGSKSVCFEMVKIGTEFVYKLYVQQTLPMQDSFHQLYTETSMPWSEGQEVNLLFSMTRYGWHVAQRSTPNGLPHRTFLELRSFAAITGGTISTYKDSTRRYSGVFATRPGVQIKKLKVSNVLAVGMNYSTGSTKTAFYDGFDSAGNWNTFAAPVPTAVSATSVYNSGISGTNAAFTQSGSYLYVAANTVPVDCVYGPNAEWSNEYVYNDGSVWHIVFDYYGGLFQMRLNPGAGPYTLHVNSTVTGAATALALESPGGKGPNVFTNVAPAFTSVTNGQYVHVVMRPTPQSQTSSSWQYPMQSATVTLEFWITNSNSIPTYGTAHGSFSASGGSAPAIGIGAGASTAYLGSLGVYNRDMASWNTSDTTWSRTTPQDFAATEAPFETTRTAAHIYKGTDKIYNKVVAG